jgi:hypothetical protein
MRDGYVINPPALLARFVLGAGLLLLAWSYALPLYLATLTPFVNGMLRLEHLPLAFELDDQTLLLICRDPSGATWRFLFLGSDAACLAAVGAAALFAATPGLKLRPRICWLSGAVALFWMIDILILYIGAHSAVLNNLEGFASQAQFPLVVQEHGFLTRSSARSYADAVGMWTASGSPALLLLIWFAAAGRSLLPSNGRATSPAPYRGGTEILPAAT